MSMYFKELFDKEKIEKQHEELLNIFKEDLSNLSDKTIKKHIQNVDFFINEYLLNRNNANYEEVNNEVDLFFRDFFIRKCSVVHSIIFVIIAASGEKRHACN